MVLIIIRWEKYIDKDRECKLFFIFCWNLFEAGSNIRIKRYI